ncbi:MAG: hypothetical protein GX180_14380 [Enterococcus sp.]|jgi:arylsulfatase A-like enzyme|nr:hypothetical protein [Enterococcus sp.]
MKKNIHFLVADDQRFDTIAALGNSDIKIPNFDWLVENGIALFKNYNNECERMAKSRVIKVFRKDKFFGKC